jgi:hypothetical protein
MSARARLATVFVAALAASCDGRECEPVACAAIACQEPFVLVVTDETTGMPIDGATASGDVPCSTAVSGVDCDAGGAGTFTVTVSAPGHSSRQVTVTVQAGVAGTECRCPICPSWQPTSVALAAE